ncbi:bacterioferritin [uncultured Thiohalocapsa sp.]|uniref:bacterioferritin n=1 Tax=uncultured Thiohalocapsa sp. TaxID=768990 RepID=UPI0025CE9B74|nr:bacterioferritin [uncultured Thiohalocapsa sp.]
MQGSSEVLAHLQSLLNCELAARDQYMGHARKFRDWGLFKLAEHLEHEQQEEAEHADKLIERMLFLEAEPDYNQQDKVNIGNDVEGMLKLDLDVEYRVAAALKDAIATCESVQDYDTRDILIQLLDDTEMDHAWWLEQQLRRIQLMGIQNYIQAQMGEDRQGAAAA